MWFNRSKVAARDLRKGNVIEHDNRRVEVEWARFLRDESGNPVALIAASGHPTAALFGIGWKSENRSGIMEVHPGTLLSVQGGLN